MSVEPFIQRWPARLWLVRHGESAGNVASQIAHLWGEIRVDIAERDVDVPLSKRGVVQSEALAKWFASLPEEDRPNALLTSPYLRARQTADLIRKEGGLSARARPPIADERLREREFGILDRLTASGVEQLHPQQAELRRVIGKFYHRPPGGESWCDVILRLRSVLDMLSLHYAGCRVLIVAHEVVVMCFRYLIEHMDEAQILGIDKQGDVVNCGVTEYECESEEGIEAPRLKLVRFNFTVPLEQEGAPLTSAKDQSFAPR
jgi:2,3-bisphosphoglycerate-dependent phosphoglycerate mutase